MSSKKPIFGLMAEFASPGEIKEAAHKAHAAGYRRAEAYTPFPIHGLPELLGFKKTRLPLLFFIGGVLGTIGAYFMCWYANVISFPWNIGGRPPNSWPLFLSITVDTMIAVSFAFGIVGLFILNGLPSPYHPLFHVPQFDRATRDRFFLCIESSDPQFDIDHTRTFLLLLQPLAIYEVPW